MVKFHNDATYVTTKYQYSGSHKKRVWVCPYFSRWVNLKDRVLDKKRGSICCEDWHKFSNFKNWLVSYEFCDKELDKDLICFLDGTVPRIYSPETCLLLLQTTNAALPSYMEYIEGDKDQGCWWSEERNNYEVRVRYKGTRKYLGRFNSLPEAKSVYFQEKLRILDLIIDEESEHNREYLKRLKEVFIDSRSY